VPLPGTLLDIVSGLRARLPGDGIAPFLEFDQTYFLPDDILVKSDRMSMAHAVEVRPPFLDHRIIEFAARIPTEMKIRGNRQKYLLKELMRSKLTPAITRRGKIGFDIPTHEWFRGPLRGMLFEALDYAESEHSEWFSMDTIRNLTKLHMNRTISVGYHLWGLMILFLWMKRWNISSAQTPQSIRQMSTFAL
jgi:asparagine synthase (glutamine-hydrolysing)